MNFTGELGNDSIIWYSASGYINDNDGELYYVGDCGYFWSASYSGDCAYCLSIDSSGGVDQTCDYTRATGFSVRCVKE